MAPIRGFFVWSGGALLILVPFYLFAILGWPAHPDSCTNIHDGRQVIPYIEGTRDLDVKHPDTCYCEHFEVQDVVEGKPGIRQKINTYSNFYALFTSLGLVFWMRWDRKKVLDGEAERKNLFWSSESWIPEVYVFAALFLGLGSMFLHASLSSTLSWFDGMSMYVFASFLPVYTVRRRLNLGIFTYTAYAVLVIVFTMLNRLPGMENASTILIMILLILYALAELFVTIYDIVKMGFIEWGKRLYVSLFKDGWLLPPLAFWAGGLICFGLAAYFRASSQTGEFMCHPKSWFQPHGLLWHTLAGVMAVLLYFYWRGLRDNDSVDDMGVSS
jgi:hypothetical protein